MIWAPQPWLIKQKLSAWLNTTRGKWKNMFFFFMIQVTWPFKVGWGTIVDDRLVSLSEDTECWPQHCCSEFRPNSVNPSLWPLECRKQRVFFCSVCRINRQRGQQGEWDKDRSMCACVFMWERTATLPLIWCGPALLLRHLNHYTSNQYTSKFIWHSSSSKGWSIIHR